MKVPQQVRTSTKVVILAAVLTVLGTVAGVATQASDEAVRLKSAQFEQAEAVQLAARERKGHKVAEAVKP